MPTSSSLPRRVLEAANQRMPFLKRCLPLPIKRKIVWSFVGGRADYEEKARLPSRQFLERTIMPWLLNNRQTVLFVGTAAYTYPYYRGFERTGVRLVTIDPHPRGDLWGARHHIEGSILDQKVLAGLQPFDAIICNGVFGFGIDSIDEMNRALEIFSGLLKPQGLLVLGWNKGCSEDPTALQKYQILFESNLNLPFAARVEFRGETHSYDIWTRRAR